MKTDFLRFGEYERNVILMYAQNFIEKQRSFIENRSRRKVPLCNENVTAGIYKSYNEEWWLWIFNTVGSTENKRGNVN